MDPASQNQPIEATQTEGKTAEQTTIRIWPLLGLLPLMVLLRRLPQLVQDGPSAIWMSAAFGPALVALVILLWWLTLSRARWRERLFGFLGLIAMLVATVALMHPSMRGVGVIVMALPLGVAAFALSHLITRRMTSGNRTWTAVAIGSAVFLATTSLKSDGVWGNFSLGLDWRWSETVEDRLAAIEQSDKQEPAPLDVAMIQASIADVKWPGLRGANRDGVNRETKIERDWNAFKPKELWRIPIGPAWSSFTVAGDVLFTQEQRGEDEMVSCYDASTGSMLWTHRLASRFFEPLGGLGPRATPELSDGVIFAMGAEGFLLALNASTGEQIWKVNVRELAKCEIPMWGFSSSPAVHDGKVFVYASGKEDKGLLALDAKTGELRWGAACGPQSYASPQMLNVLGRDLLAILSDLGLHLYDPENGDVELLYEWKHDGYRSLQPQLVGENRVLVPTGLGTGTGLIEISETDGKLSGEEIWESKKLKPDFNDCVIHQDFIYGFDDSIFTCVSLADGSATWKKGRYGKGQVLLIEKSDALIVQCETGEIILLDATPESHKELGKLPGPSGKSWNHPVVVGNRLYTRSAEEAVCYELAIEDPTQGGLSSIVGKKESQSKVEN